jgi:uncharacterized membrane protein YciS (DUF1049 family)
MFGYILNKIISKIVYFKNNMKNISIENEVKNDKIFNKQKNFLNKMYWNFK